MKSTSSESFRHSHPTATTSGLRKDNGTGRGVCETLNRDMSETGATDRAAEGELLDLADWTGLVDQLEAKVLLVRSDFGIVFANQAATAVLGPQIGRAHV